MNDVVKKWVAALRSGEYKQTKKFLHTRYAGEDRFCCLGVLCDLAVKEGIIPSPSKSDRYHNSYDHERAYLPDSVMEWVKINESTGEYDAVGGNLSGLNDKGKSFSEIADIIESDPPGLFYE